MFRFIALFVLFCLNSCSVELNRLPKPDDLIEEKKFENIMYELILIESYIESKHPSIVEFKTIMKNSGDEICKKNNVSPETFEASFDYYCSNQEEMMTIYNRILNKMNVELNELQSGKKVEK
jgi:hypothetical protein